MIQLPRTLRSQAAIGRVGHTKDANIINNPRSAQRKSLVSCLRRVRWRQSGHSRRVASHVFQQAQQQMCPQRAQVASSISAVKSTQTLLADGTGLGILDWRLWLWIGYGMFVLCTVFLHPLCRGLFREDKAGLAAFLGLQGGKQEKELFLESENCTRSDSFKKAKKS